VLGIYAAMAVLLAASWLVGHALLRALGSRIDPALAPAFGFALLLTVGVPAIRLPGDDVTALVALALLVAAALALLRGRPPRPAASDLWLALAVLVAITIPFAANGRLGVLGAGKSDDFGLNFGFVDVLRAGSDIASLNPATYDGYPIGAHALAGALAALPGLSTLAALTAVEAVCPLLIALAVRGCLARDLGAHRAVVSGALAGLGYFVAASFGVGSFKEVVMATLALSFALALRSLWQAETSGWRDGLALGVLIAGAVAAFGLPALAWPLAFAGALLGYEALRHRGRPRQGESRQALTVIVPAIAAAAILLAPQLERHLSFEAAETAANDPAHFGGWLGDRELNAQQALGIWPSDDLRVDPAALPLVDLVAAAALAAALLGSVWWFRRGDPVLPLCALAAGAIVAAAAPRYGPYITAKTWIALGPLLALLIFPPLLAWTRAPSPPRIRTAAAAVLLALGGIAAWSSLLVLRGSAVGPLDRVAELRELRAVVGDRPLLLAVTDDYSAWELDPSGLYPVLPYGTGTSASFRNGRDPVAEGRVDLDQIRPGTFDRFDFAITTRSDYTSTPPPSWQLIRRTRSFLLYRTRGSTGARGILAAEREGPGAVLDCDTAAGAAVARRDGIAAVLPTPVAGPASDWRFGPQPPRFADAGYAAIKAGSTLTQELRLGRGEWQLSLQYHSPMRLMVRAGRREFSLPADLTPKGNAWVVGSIHSRGGAVPVSVSADSPGPLAVANYAEIGPLAAVREPVGTRAAAIVPLRSACGRYVDWYLPR
jgi:hypothetical protein